MGKRKDKTGLDAREEIFCLAYARHRNARIAYEAYLPGSKAQPETKRVAGYQMLNRPHIAIRIEQLRQAAIKMSHATVGTILKEIDEARELAMEIEQPGVACAATMDKARLAGLLKSGGEAKRDVASVSIVLSAEDLALG
jgi:phage terminase small subunit